MFAAKLLEKITDTSNAKKHYQSFIKKHKTSKAMKTNYSATKHFWKSKYGWYTLSYYVPSKIFHRNYPRL